MLAKAEPRTWGWAIKTLSFAFSLFVSGYALSTGVSFTRYEYTPSGGESTLAVQMAQMSLSGASSGNYGHLTPLAKMSVDPLIDETTSHAHAYWTSSRTDGKPRIVTRDVERHAVFSGESKAGKPRWIVYEDVAPSWDFPDSMHSRKIGEAWNELGKGHTTSELLSEGYVLQHDEQSKSPASDIPDLVNLRVSYFFAKVKTYLDRDSLTLRRKYDRLKELVAKQLEMWQKHPVLDDIAGDEVIEMSLLFAKVPKARSYTDLPGLSKGASAERAVHERHCIGFETKRRNKITAVIEVRWDILAGKEHLCSQEDLTSEGIQLAGSSEKLRDEREKHTSKAQKMNTAHLRQAGLSSSAIPVTKTAVSDGHTAVSLEVPVTGTYTATKQSR
ncbi:hypothetical protein M3P05_10600 [Sansalvadorimonas sp. 2012CJ34-2]|uniref:Uncharacterized protein n=1 Tax=Parendozoicomonas callyspongiae TaxID=2942213 RepID=A0ABT0PG68_9GAMM|nr:hypothetical protein [Sansalvadorimonas sp. 2012CJ34-2]MCL6270369.1 hypothetical protein [Sansalvadorimonas sp. 2012CJ34-2]